MIKCHLSRYMGEAKEKIADVATATGLHRNTVGLLYHETAVRVDFDALELLCHHYQCQPGDLLEWLPEDKLPAPKPRITRGRPRSN